RAVGRESAATSHPERCLCRRVAPPSRSCNLSRTEQVRCLAASLSVQRTTHDGQGQRREPFFVSSQPARRPLYPIRAARLSQGAATGGCRRVVTEAVMFWFSRGS